MLKKVNKPEIKKLLKENGSVDIKIGTYKNGICYGGTYNKTIHSMEELEEAHNHAVNNGWAKGSAYFIVKD